MGVELGRLLAEYGADVLKVESPDFPDFIRTIMGTMMNPSFASSSRSKRGFAVDVKTKKGLEVVERLVRRADVFIENNAAGVMERLGLGPRRLRELNPRIVAFSSNMTGSKGPWSHWVGYGPSTHPLAGLQWLWNYPEDVDQPAGSTNVHPDHLVGRVGAMAVLAGLVGTRTHRPGHACGGRTVRDDRSHAGRSPGAREPAPRQRSTPWQHERRGFSLGRVCVRGR